MPPVLYPLEYALSCSALWTRQGRVPLLFLVPSDTLSFLSTECRLSLSLLGLGCSPYLGCSSLFLLPSVASVIAFNPRISLPPSLSVSKSHYVLRPSIVSGPISIQPAQLLIAQFLLYTDSLSIFLPHKIVRARNRMKELFRRLVKALFREWNSFLLEIDLLRSREIHGLLVGWSRGH